LHKNRLYTGNPVFKRFFLYLDIAGICVSMADFISFWPRHAPE
jgi:hypothetical protein